MCKHRRTGRMKTANPRHRIICGHAPIADRVSLKASMTYRPIGALYVLSLAVVLVLVITGACHTNQSRPVSGSAAPTSDQRAQTSTRTQENQQRSRTKSTSAVRIALSGRVLLPGAVEIVVGNHDSSEVRLEDQLEVERYKDGGWQSFGAQDVRLRYSCETKIDGCVELLPGVQLYPPPWQAASGPSQCRSRVNAPAPAGRYRFIAKSCDRTFVVFGEPFQL